MLNRKAKVMMKKTDSNRRNKMEVCEEEVRLGNSEGDKNAMLLDDPYKIERR
jgi:hypothetical protein